MQFFTNVEKITHIKGKRNPCLVDKKTEENKSNKNSAIAVSRKS